MNRLYKFCTALFATVFFFVSLTACLKDGNHTIGLPTPYTIGGIPSDNSATMNPEIEDPNASISDLLFEQEAGDENMFIYRFFMDGILHPETHEWLNLYGTGHADQNVWVSLDGSPKGILVENHYGDDSRSLDIVFLVDNSVSMGDESDALADAIIDWSRRLSYAVKDVKFGCIGYSENGRVNGGLDLTDQIGLDTFLNYGTGTVRTQHFGGDNGSVLNNHANYYGSSSGPCGMMALRFADEYLSFRSGAERVYINFTDSPNQPGEHDDWSVEYLNPDNGYWTSQQGKVHTVFSGGEIPMVEAPWLMSEYTGGTVLYASPSFSGVSLNDLPETAIIQFTNSIAFTVPVSMKDGISHGMMVTVLTPDDAVRAERFFVIKFE